MPSDYNEAVAVLSTLWQGAGYGEIRVLGDDGALRPYWLPLPLRIDHLSTALSWAYARNAEGYNVYFGVHPRSTRRGRNVDVQKYYCLVADLDKPDLSWPLYTQLAEAGFTASMCVRTPRGMHLYWLLKEPEDVLGAARTRMQRLQAAILSDAVHDPARILRLPGAVCHKTEVKTPVYVCWISPDLTYTSEEIDQAVTKLWPNVRVEEASGRQGELSAPLAIAESADTAWVSEFALPLVKGERSEYCVAFIRTAVLHGWDDQRIAQMVLSLPLGGHYLDRGRNGEASFDYDLGKIKRSISQDLYYSLRVMIETAGMITNPDGTRKLKLRLKPYAQRYVFGTGFNVWLSDPTDGNLGHLRRWQALLACTNLSVNVSEDELLNLLPGKCVRVIMHDDGKAVARFLPDAGS